MHIVLIYIKNNLHINWFTTKMSVNMEKIHFENKTPISITVYVYDEERRESSIFITLLAYN